MEGIGMTLAKAFKLNVSIICLTMLCGGTLHAAGVNYGIQSAWDNPNANMAAGSTKPGYAQLSWSKGSVLPVKLRNGMTTLITLPTGEKIADAVLGNDGLFSIDATIGGSTMYITPVTSNQGSDTNLIVTGESGNKYLFYLRSEPSNSSEITYSQVDVSLEDGSSIANSGTATNATGGSSSIFKKVSNATNTVGVDGEDYGWIKSMKIDPSEFRFDLDIYVPNPDDYVIAPERVWRDKIFTYIDFGDKVISMTQRPVVSLLIEGGESPVSFRTDGEDGRLLIVEAVGDMVLRSGQRIVCIKKREKPFLIADTASVMALAEANVAQSIMSGQSLNNIAYTADVNAINASANGYTTTPMLVGNLPTGTTSGYYAPAGYALPTATYGTSSNTTLSMIPTERLTAGSFLPQSNIPLITSNQTGVAIELKSDTSVKALDEYWANLLAKFSGDNGQGLLTPYKDMVFFAVDEQGVGDLGSESSTGRLYRLRIGPLSDVNTAQELCNKLTDFSGTTCSVVRVQ